MNALKVLSDTNNKKSVKELSLTLFYIIATLNEPAQACYQYVQ